MKKVLLPILITAVLAGCNSSQSSFSADGEFSEKQKEQIAQVASQYIIDHPEVLIKASETLQKKQMEEQAQVSVDNAIQYVDQLVKNDKTPFVGPKDAKVNVIEFFDYQCLFCSKVAPVVKVLQANNPDVKFIYKETPIFANRWEASKYAADMGNWIFQQKGSEAYAKYHDSVFATGKDEGKLGKEDVNAAAKAAGVDISKFDADNTFIENFQLFSAIGFKGTPALIVMPTENPTRDNVKVIRGYDPDGLKAAIESVKASVK